MKVNKTIVRYEPYYDEWITMEENGDVFSIEFDDTFNEEDYPHISFIKPDFTVENACSVPIVVQILLTRKCNYRCLNCHVHSSENRNELSTKEVLKIIEDCANKGVLQMRFSGGEATLRDDFTEIVKYARSLGLKCSLLSNCKNLTQEQIDIMSDLCYVQPHLDSVVEETFNKLTGGNNFKNFQKNLLYLLNRGIKINPAATLQKENMNEFKGMISFCAEHKLPLKISAIHGDGLLDEQSWIEYYSSIVLPFQDKWKELKQYADTIKCDVAAFVEQKEWESNIKDTMAVISPWGRSYITIDSEGKIYPFSLLLKDDLIIGNIRKGDDLFEIWRNSELLNTIRFLTKEKLGCGNCRIDCVYCNPFFSYSYFGEFGKVLPHENCPNRKFS